MPARGRRGGGAGEHAADVGARRQAGAVGAGGGCASGHRASGRVIEPLLAAEGVELDAYSHAVVSAVETLGPAGGSLTAGDRRRGGVGAGPGIVLGPPGHAL